MKKTILTLFATALISSAHAVSLEESVSQAIDQLNSGDASGLALSSFSNPQRAATLLSSQAARITITNSFARQKIIYTALALEQKALAQNLQGPGQSTNGPFAASLIRVIQQESSPYVVSVAAKGLRDLFSPAMLQSFADDIYQAVTNAPQPEVLLLYGQLPSLSLSQLQALLQRLDAHMDQETKNAATWVLAKYGVATAEDTLLNAMTRLSQNAYVDLDRVVDALSYAQTPRIKKALAEGLRSENIIEMPGGSQIPKRNGYACALVKSMRQEPSFPSRKETLLYTDDELDQMESWCSGHLDITYPTEPRKKITSTPSNCFSP